jgi:hypothetical protein
MCKDFSNTPFIRLAAARSGTPRGNLAAEYPCFRGAPVAGANGVPAADHGASCPEKTRTNLNAERRTCAIAATRPRARLVQPLRLRECDDPVLRAVPHHDRHALGAPLGKGPGGRKVPERDQLCI